MRTLPLAIVIGAAVVTAACGASVTTPRMRVARDLGCTAEQTTVQRLSDHRWHVTGCGRSGVYVCTYPVVRDCWREGEVRTGGVDGADGARP